MRALTIIPTFDSSITNNANAATIQATINTAIQFFEARFSNNATVTIQYKTINTAGDYGQSSWWYYSIPYVQFRAALAQYATTPNDAIALAHLPAAATNPITGTSTIKVKTAHLHALGFTGMDSALDGGYDAVIGVHVSELNLSRPATDANKGDLLATVEHEMDEVLGLGSGLDSNSTDPFPQDLFRYNAEGARTYATNGDDAWFSLDGTNFLARFNQEEGDDFGDWWFAGPHTPQVQDAFATNGAMPDPGNELTSLDVIGYILLPAPRPRITATTVSGTQVTLTGTNGMGGGTYFILASTNLATPVNQWTRIVTNYRLTNGNFTITVPNGASPSIPKRFFALELQ